MAHHRAVSQAIATFPRRCSRLVAGNIEMAMEESLPIAARGAAFQRSSEELDHCTVTARQASLANYSGVRRPRQHASL